MATRRAPSGRVPGIRALGTTVLSVLVLAACGGGAAPSSHTTTTNLPSATPTPSASATTGPVAQKMEAPLPEPIQDNAEAALTTKLYVLGGFDAAAHTTTRVFVFDGSAWRRGPDLPVPLNHPAAAAAAGRLYVAGGYTDDGQSQPTAKTYILSTAGDAWLTAAPMTHPRAAMALINVSERLYAVGGSDGKKGVEPVEVYSPDVGTWRDLPALPAPRDHVAGFTYQSMACAAGGRSPNTARVDCYSVADQAWRRLADLPMPTSGAGAASVGDSVFVAGGEGLGTGAQIIDQLAVFKAGSWRRDIMLAPRHDLQMTLFGGRAWACGGATMPGFKASTACTSIG